MKKIIIALTLVLAFYSCKGPGSGPLVKESFKKTDNTQTTEGQNYKSKVAIEKANITVEPCEGCITISNLLANKKSYSGKIIKIKGQVTKYNPEIMGKNWVHIQDGTEFQGEYDLTITTDIPVNVGQIVTFEGKIALDKDFGYGYLYNVIMEEGKPVL